MAEQSRATPPINAAKLAVAGVIIAGGALALAGQAGAQPLMPYPTPVPSDPGAPTAAPGQPVMEPADAAVAAPAPPPIGAPVVPQIANPAFGSGSGPLGSLRDLWHQAQNPYDLTAPPAAAAPPPGAGPAPQLPPGYQSINAPGSNGPPPTGSYEGGPPLPPGYYPLNGPPPPGYELPVDPAAPPPVTPVPPTP